MQPLHMMSQMLQESYLDDHCSVSFLVAVLTSESSRTKYWSEKAIGFRMRMAKILLCICNDYYNCNCGMNTLCLRMYAASYFILFSRIVYAVFLSLLVKQRLVFRWIIVMFSSLIANVKCCFRLINQQCVHKQYI